MTTTTPANIVTLARAIAGIAHHGQTRVGGEPYINHPARVAAGVAAKGGTDIEVAAAWMHDVPEDTAFTLDILAEMFPAEVIAIVDALTRRDGEPYMDLVHRAAAHPSAKKIKVEDNLDNTATLDQLPPDRAKSMRKRYAKALAVLSA